MDKLLIVGPAWVGDMVMAQTLFKLLQNTQPGIVIDVLAPEVTHPLLARMPEINQAHVLPLTHGEFAWQQRYHLGKQLREKNYTQAIVLPNSFKSALIPFWARIPKRTGWLGEMRWGLLNDPRHLNKTQFPLMIQRFAALGLPKNISLPTTLPSPELQVSTESVARTLAKLDMQPPQQRVLALCPGAEYGPAKRWPGAYFAEVAKAKLKEGWEVWLLGSLKDRPITEEIQTATEEACKDLSGQTTLTEAIDLLSLANAVLCNDSGLMHITAALKRPLIVIYGSSDPRFTPPLSDHVKILSLNLECSPCFERTCPLHHYNCLRNLTPVPVLQAFADMGL